MSSVYVTAQFDIVAGHEQEVLSAFEKLAKETRMEPGCISYILARSLENPLSCTILECWDSERDLEAHLQTPHIKSFQKAVEGMRENRLTRKLQKAI